MVTDRWTDPYLAPRAPGAAVQFPRQPPSRWAVRVVEETCRPGEEVSIATKSCSPCAPGHFRNTRMSTCEPCPTNSFAALPRAAYCEPCPFWGDCIEPDRVPVPAQGWYVFGDWPNPDRSQVGILLPVYCPQVGTEGFCIGSNECGGHQMGALCLQCEPGYTNQRLFA